MAAGLGFKTFNTGEVLTAADVNGYLMQGILVFATEAARNSAITSPQEGQFAYTKDNNSLWYYTGSAWVASGASGGKILQVVQGTTTTSTTSTSSTYIDSTLTASITPALASSKVLVIVSLLGIFTAANNTGISPKLVRGATDLVDYFAMPQIPENGSGHASDGFNWNISYLDSPATTSATTYKIQIKSHNGATVTVQKNGVSSFIQLLEVGA